MSVKVVEKNGERALFGDFEPFHLDICEDMFDVFNLEIWSDGRGGDNSAIGVSGCHEPWDRVWILSSQLQENIMARIEVVIKKLDELLEKIDKLQELVDEQSVTIRRIEGLTDELDNRL